MEDSTAKKRYIHDPNKLSFSIYLKLKEEAEKGNQGAIKKLEEIDPLRRQQLDAEVEQLAAIGASVQKQIQEIVTPINEKIQALIQGQLEGLSKALEGFQELFEQARRMDEAIGTQIRGEAVFDDTYPEFDETNNCYILAKEDGTQFKFYLDEDGKVYRIGIEYDLDANKGELQRATKALLKRVKQAQNGGKTKGSKESTTNDYMSIARAWEMAKDSGMSASEFCERMKITEAKRKAALRFAKKYTE